MIDFDYVWKLALRDTDISQHILYLYAQAVTMDAKVVVEVGSGQSSFVFTAAMNKTGGQFYSHDFSIDATLRFFPEGEGVLEKEKRFHFVPGDGCMSAKKWDQPIDLFFLDSSHEYTETFGELEAWSGFVKDDGLILMHDIHPSWVACRDAMLDFCRIHEYDHVDMLNQNGLSVLRRKHD